LDPSKSLREFKSGANDFEHRDGGLMLDFKKNTRHTIFSFFCLNSCGVFKNPSLVSPLSFSSKSSLLSFFNGYSGHQHDRSRKDGEDNLDWDGRSDATKDTSIRRTDDEFDWFVIELPDDERRNSNFDLRTTTVKRGDLNMSNDREALPIQVWVVVDDGKAFDSDVSNHRDDQRSPGGDQFRSLMIHQFVCLSVWLQFIIGRLVCEEL
jgi:hypothetical protein